MAVEHPPTTTPGDQTRIHDIGYRGYDGPRLGRSYATRSLYSQTLRGSYGLGRSVKSKILPMLLFAVMCVPAAIMVAVAVTTKANDLPLTHAYTRYAIVMQAVISLYVASQAPQAVSRDLRFKTVPLYFSRPIETADYVRAKFAALASALFILTGAPLLVLYVGSLLAKMGFAHQSEQLALGLVTVALLSLLFAGLGLVIASVTPRRGFGIAAVIAVLTISYGAVSAVQTVAFNQGNAVSSVPWIGLFSPVTLIDGVQSSLLGGSSSYPGGTGPSHAQGVVFILVVLGLIAACYGLLVRRYKKVGL